MISKKHWLTLVLLVATLNLIHIHANESGSSGNKQPTADDNASSLENLTNEELEAICTTRGFELVKELDENGKEKIFTRENYMDAARQCLDVEAEM
jgi:hypothetical protein